MQNRVGIRLLTEQRYDEEVRPYIQQLMKAQSFSQAQTSEDNNSIYIDVELNYEPGSFLKLEIINYVHKIHENMYSFQFASSLRSFQPPFSLIMTYE